MGEVYRALDIRLDRTVAIKVLPTRFSADPVRKQRFEREAKTISSLNHPHICVLHDVGHQDGMDYLVMECLEGESLAKRLEKGALPLEQVLKFGPQIADALDKAHRNGVVHRDLKPANIMLTPSGAKLLDFGLAKPATPLLAGATMTVATRPPPVTEEGTIVGTFQYMSPEQIEGKDVDGRSDIFSLGAVLYEMVTGQPPFQGKSQLSIASAILEKEPASISTIKPMTAPALDHAIQKCLAKTPDERWQSASDLASELKWTAESGALVGTFTFGSQAKVPRQCLPWSVAALLGATTALTAFLYWGKKSPVTEPVRFTISAPQQTKFAPGPPWGSPLAVSPDGRRLVFVALGKDGTRRLWLRPLDALAAQVLPGTEGASAPFWSPDSEWVAFFADNRLKRIAVSRGETETLCQCQSGGGGGTWNQNNVILFSPALAGEGGLFRVPASGGTPVQVTELDAGHGEANQTWPFFLPDGRHFLYHRNYTDGAAIYVGDLYSPSGMRLLPLDMSVLDYAPPGYLLYAHDRVLFAQPFDAKRLTLAGDPIRVVDGVEEVGPGSAAFSVSSNGVLVYWGGATPPQQQLTWVGRDGTRIAPVGEPGEYYHFSLSPDGRRVAVTAYESGAKGIPTAIWLLDGFRGTATKFSFQFGAGIPVWSPDGARIAFSYDNRPGPPTVYLKPTGGPEQYDLLVEAGGNQPTDWSADGDTVVLEHRDPKTQNDLWPTSVSGERKSRPLLATPANETGGRLSPDGRWMAYTSDESGRNEIYVISLLEPHGATRISTDGGMQPEWRRDGSELFYRTPDRKLMAVPLKAGAVFDAGKPHELFTLPPEPPAWIQGGADQRVYAPSADGQRFLIGAPVGEGSSTPITVILGWDGALKKK
jgi:serine/threonine protein kinase